MQKKSIDLIWVGDKNAGQRYSDTYGKYLEVFKEINEFCVVDNAPRCWVPLLYYLGASVNSMRWAFPEDDFIPFDSVIEFGGKFYRTEDPRHMVEVFCAMRPELIDALWKIDNQWKKPISTMMDGRRDIKKDMLITTTNSFDRPEIKKFISEVGRYKSVLGKCVITNCSADKPYPSEVHKRIKTLYPEHELLVISGVTGIVPERFFPMMPNYDSGMPNFWRIKKLSADYFIRNRYDEIVVFTEFNQYALNETLMQICPDSKIIFKFPHQHYIDYIIDDEFMKGYNE